MSPTRRAGGWFDPALAAVLLVAAEVEMTVRPRSSGPFAVELGVVAAMILPLAWRRRASLPVAVVVMAMLVVFKAISGDVHALTFPLFVALIAAYSVGAGEPRARAARRSRGMPRCVVRRPCGRIGQRVVRVHRRDRDGGLGGRGGRSQAASGGHQVHGQGGPDDGRAHRSRAAGGHRRALPNSPRASCRGRHRGQRHGRTDPRRPNYYSPSMQMRRTRRWQASRRPAAGR